MGFSFVPEEHQLLELINSKKANVVIDFFSSYIIVVHSSLRRQQVNIFSPVDPCSWLKQADVKHQPKHFVVASGFLICSDQKSSLQHNAFKHPHDFDPELLMGGGLRGRSPRRPT